MDVFLFAVSVVKPPAVLKIGIESGSFDLNLPDFAILNGKEVDVRGQPLQIEVAN
jgi:hypothetical protein